MQWCGVEHGLRQCKEGQLGDQTGQVNLKELVVGILQELRTHEGIKGTMSTGELMVMVG